MSSVPKLDPKHKAKFFWKPGDLRSVDKAKEFDPSQPRDEHGRWFASGVATMIDTGFGSQRGTQWDFDPRDTAIEQRALRENPVAQENRAEFPRGTRIVSVGARSHPTEGMRGTVDKTHPDGSADGGSVGVTWDDIPGFVGQVNPNAIVREDEWDQFRAMKSFKYSDDQPRDDHGRWTDGGGDSSSGPDPTAMHAALYGEHAGTPADPVPCGADIERAARIIGDGGHVTLDQPQQISTLLDKVQDMVKEAQDKGEKAPVYDLCNASVPGTNLFCQDDVKGRDNEGNIIGIDRIRMPQLATTDPVPGSPADALPRNEFGEVDMSGQFAEFLAQTGRPPVEETIDAKLLRASQDELNGAKVAGIADAIASGDYDPTTGRIWITSDDYIIDGHHRWAATVAEEYRTGETIQIPVRRLDMDIGTALTTADYWTEEQGIQGRDAAAKAARLAIDALEVLGLVLPMPKYSPDQPRDDHGRFGSTDGGGSSDYRSTWKPQMTPAEGHAWAEAAGTKWPGTVVHVTNAPAVRGIIGTGFHTESITTLHEAGAFFATDPATAEFYEYKGDDVVSAVVVVQNPLTVDLVPTIEKANSDGGWLPSFASSPEFRSAALEAAGIPSSDARTETAMQPIATTAAIKAQGYDSVIIHGLPTPDSMIGDNEAAVGGDQIVVFDKEQAVVIGTEHYVRDYSGDSAFGTSEVPTGIEDATQRAFAKTLNFEIDLATLGIRMPKEFDETQHPRDDHGRWATAEGTGGTPIPTAGYAAEAALRREDALRYAADEHHTTPEQLKADSDAHVRDIINGTVTAIRVDSSNLGQILDDGQLQNRFQNAASDSMTSEDGSYWREQWEEEAFGLPKDVPPEDRPVYGFLADDPATTELKGGTPQGVGLYGDIVLVMKDDVADRTTFTLGDSGALNATPYEVGMGEPEVAPNAVPQPVKDPNSDAWDWGGEHTYDVVNPDTGLPDYPYPDSYTETPLDLPSADDTLRGGGYYEAQIHGGVKTSDIAEVVFTVDTSKVPYQSTIDSLQQRLTDMGIPWRNDFQTSMDPYVLRPGDNPETSPTAVYHYDPANTTIDAQGRAIPKSKEFVEEQHPRDDHGRFATGGGGGGGTQDLGAVTAGSTDLGSQNNIALFDALTKEEFADRKNDVENAPRLKSQNVEQIGAALAERAQSDPALASQLQTAAQSALSQDEDYQTNHLHLEPGMSPEQIGAAQVAATLQDSWMNAASDSNPGSWAMQLAAADMMGVDTSAAKAFLDQNGLVYPNVPAALGIDVPDGLSPSERAQYMADTPAVKAYVSEVYDRTQSYLADQGISGEITLFRGSDQHEGIQTTSETAQTERGVYLDDGERGVATLNPLSSFSTDTQVAVGFGYTVFQSTIPTERIFSMATTGPGCLHEDEAIIIGGPGIGVEAVNPYG